MRGDEWQMRIPVQNPCTYSTIVINDYNEMHAGVRRYVRRTPGLFKYTYVKYNPLSPSPTRSFSSSFFPSSPTPPHAQSKQNYFSTLIRWHPTRGDQ